MKKITFVIMLIFLFALIGFSEIISSDLKKTSSSSAPVSGDLSLDGFTSWTKNPGLNKDTGLWWVRTFSWTIGADCPDDVELSRAEWATDGHVLLRAEDESTRDLCCDCAAMTQGTGTDGSVRGHPLERIRTGDVEAAYILLRRSDSGATPCTGIEGAGNIINFWLRHPDGAIWVTDLYFETKGLNQGFKERTAPHSKLVTLFSPLPHERGNDWYAYQILIEKHPQYWDKTVHPDGSVYWVIDLKAILDRGAEFSKRDLSDYLWHYVDVVSEDVCVGGKVGQSAAWQNIHYFEIKYKLRDLHPG
jgi:hypothetical protein